MLPMILLVALSLGLVGGISSWLNYQSTLSSMEQTMTETSKIASDRVAHQLKEYANVAMETGTIARLSSPQLGIEEKRAVLELRVKQYALAGCGILNQTGQDLFREKYMPKKYFFRKQCGGIFIFLNR